VTGGRVVTLVLQARDGSVVGTLAPFEVDTPWWSEAATIVETARGERGVDVTVLRLLHAEADPDDPWKMGGTGTYAAELDGAMPVDLRATDRRTAAAARDDHPLRLPWARPGGPARELDWAAHALAERGRELTGRPRQMRTWNLSSIWSIPTTGGTVWLKSVPPFFAHEGRIIEWLADPSLPPLLAWADGRLLMDDIAGDDQYDAALPTLLRAVDILVAIQDRVRDRADELLALGLPDWRWRALRPRIDDVVDRHRHELDVEHTRVLDAFLAGFDDRCAAIDACGLPMTLVHGDFHPGNLRGDDAHLVLLDWGDCGVGHPLFDVPAMLRTLDSDRSVPLMTAWTADWLEHCPGSDPRRAANLIEPIAALRQAVVYRSFLDQIEPSEHCYHDGDPALWLRNAAARLVP
jgi:Ser/Thr protein kinase RdoA (MazF antagonist)